MKRTNFGACCACGGHQKVRNVLMLPKKAPEPGTGWGCVVCGLSADGAVAVVCDRCLESKKPIQSAIKGFAKSGQRVPVTSLVGEHKHNEQLHKLEEN